jgi:ribose 5-phosphate isomerase RpiB
MFILSFFLAGTGILATVNHAQGIKAAIVEDKQERVRAG